MRKLDPKLLSPDELLSEWSIREEELRLQNEQLKNAEQSLAKTANRFEQLFKRLPVVVVLIDSRGFVKDANAAAFDAFPIFSRMVNFYFPRLLDEASTRALLAVLEGDASDQDADIVISTRNEPQTFKLTVIRIPDDASFDCALVLTPA